MDSIQKALADMKLSSRVTDRKDAAERLEDYITNDESMILKLNCNSVQMDKKQGDKLTWTMVFIEVRDYFVKETERGSPTLPSRLFYFGLVRRVFDKATSNGPLLSWNKVYDFILSNLQKDKNARLYGSELMGMLQRFLEIDLYRSFLDAPAWIELMTTILKCYERKQVPIAPLLNCLRPCIARGSLYDSVIPCIRSNVVNFYCQLAQTASATVQQNLLSYLQGLIELCNENAVEFRGILCQLGEIVIPSILQIQSFNEEEEVALVEFLLVQYSLHMPFDCALNSHAFHADDAAKWKEILRSMYSYCIDVIEEMGRRTTSGCGRVTERFLLLAAKCTKQISSPLMLESDNSDDEDGGIRPKKKMRYKFFSTIISDIYRKPITDGLAVWLSFFKTVLTTYPELIGNKINFSNLMYLGTSLFNTRFMIRREFYEYFSGLLEAEKYLRKRRIITANDVTDTWSTVWDLTIKSTAVCEGKQEAVNLLRKLLKEIHPTNVTPLLMLYVNNYMPLLKCSVELLAEYLSLITLPVQINDSNFASQNVYVDEAIAVTSCPRVALIRWLLNISNSNMTGFEPLVAAVMCSLIVKQTDILIKQEIELFPESIKVYKDFEKKLLKCSFVKEPEIISAGEQDLKKTEVGSSKIPASTGFIVLQRPAERLADALQMDHDKIPGLHVTTGGGRARVRLNYDGFVSKVSLYINILNVIEKHSIGESASSGQVGFRTVLERVFDSGMEKCNSIIMERLHAEGIPGRSPETVTCIIESSRKLFSNRKLCDKMRMSLSQKFGLQVLEVIKRVFRSHLTAYIRGALNNIQEGNVMFFAEDMASDVRMLASGNFDRPEELYLMTKRDLKYEKMSLTALQFLIDYGVNCQHKLEMFSDIVKDLLAERACSAHLYMFDASAILISEVAKILGSTGVQDMIGPTVELLQKLCRGYHMFTHCLETLWILLKDLTPHIAKHEGVSRSHFMILFGTAFKLLEAHPKVPKTLYRNAFDAFVVLAKNDPGLTWSEFTPAKSRPVWVLEELHKFLSSKCQEVRQLAADSICQMYEWALPFDYSKGIADSQEKEPVSDNGSVEYQERRKNFLDSVFEALMNCFDVEANLSDAEASEEGVNRTSLTLSCLTRLIFAFPYSQKQNIMFLFLIVKLKTIDVHLAKRALEYSSSNATKTMCCYLSYVLKKILKLKHSVDGLPFQFFGCENLNAFLTKFQDEICVEYFEQNKMNELEVFAKSLNVSVKDLVEQCYGLIMARLTPGLASHAFPNLNNRGLNIEKCNEVHRRMIETLGGKDATDTLMAKCVGDVILNLISLTFEPSIVDRWGSSEIKMAEPVPPHYPEATIETCLDFLKAASPQKNLSLIGYLAKTSHQSIYKIMLSLTIRIHEAHDELEKYWRLYQFSFFVNLLMGEPPEIFSLIQEYVCSFAFNAYLRLLKTGGGGGSDRKEEKNVQFLDAVIHQILYLVVHIQDYYIEEMKEFFNPVIRGLVSAVIEYPVLIRHTKEILKFLLKTAGSKFISEIKALDPFPSGVPEFEEYEKIRHEMKYEPRRSAWPLSKEFEIFMQEADKTFTAGSYICTKERLQFLKDLLSNSKKDLERMVKNLENKQFSQDCLDDPLHKIIHMLTSIASSPTRDEEVAIEACKCLGEIGPVNLSVLVLPSHKSQGKITTKNHALKVIIEIISGYLSSEDIQLVTESGKVLQNLLEFQECSNIVNVTLGDDQRLSKILLPFRCMNRNKQKASVEKLECGLLESKLQFNEMDEGIDYKNWLTQLTKGIIECFRGNSSDVSVFLPLCNRLDFCEDVFPYVVYKCLYGGRTNPIVKRILSGYIRNFFTKFLTNLNNMADSIRCVTPSSSGATSPVIYLNRLALRCLIRVTQFLRRHPLPEENRGNVRTTKFDNNFWVDINYLDVARAAQYCGAYLTSILYTEIGATELDRNRSNSHYDAGPRDEDSTDQFYSQGIAMYPKNRNDAFKVEKLLLKAYSNIGEADAAFGCGSARFGDGSVHHLEQTNNWVQLLVTGNGSSANSDSCSEFHVAQALSRLGLYNALGTYLKGVEAENKVMPEELQPAQFECAWRLSQWNVNTDKPTYVKDFVEAPAHAAFQMSIHDSIQTNLTKDKANNLTALRNGYRSVRTDLRHATLESSVNLYGFLSRLQMLRVVEDFPAKNDDLVDVKRFLDKWKAQDKIAVGDFKYQEPILYLRSVLLRAYDLENAKVDLESEITTSLLGLIIKAREATHLVYADSCCNTLASICTKPCLAREFEVAKIIWAQEKKRQDALFIMNQLIKKSSKDDDIYPSLLLQFGEWLSEKHSERPAVILEKYLQRAVTLYEKKLGSSSSAIQDVANGYTTLAKYADAQYQNVTKYINSDVFQSKVEHVKRTQADKHHLENLDQQVKMAAKLMLRHCSNDDAEIKCILEEQTKFLKLALTHYLLGLKASSDRDLLIFRAISLWLEDGNDKDEELIEETTRIFSEISLPTHKYIVVLHQLSARLSNKPSQMNNLLKEILVKCAEEHPYHTLPVLLTQASLHKDENLPTPRKNSSLKVQLAGRVQAAADIVAYLLKTQRLSKLVSRMEVLWLALIKLANINDGRANADGIKKNIPADVMKQLAHLETIAVPTSSIPVLSSMNYKESVIGIASFGTVYGLVGGINSPKKISCRGTNGIEYNMLLKGQDDLRQDAVMQQVFGVMNKLLQVEPDTKTRRLHIRTYKVIPLSQRTGLIEWVENTQTLGEYLTGNNYPDQGAHVRYRPNDYKPMECRRLLIEARQSGDNEKRYSIYMTICEHFKPVFRHFFLENFNEAGEFFEKRLAYTRSVATNSIVGYILGLGDRHVLNILIDKNTAELIHIDLGVAFEQGRILPTPELIPFRLTRDIIDGMGISGAEGVFRKCSEMTMSVLRKNSEIIITVLQVLLYDPLYMWTLSSDRVARVQPSDTTKTGRKSKSIAEPAAAEESANERNNAASRVLLRLRQKLMGIEEEGGQTGAISSGQTISVDGHVSLLIQRAIDPDKLCKLFPGWQPYL